MARSEVRPGQDPDLTGIWPARPSREQAPVLWHRWSYGEHPHRATERYCLFCGIECRRKAPGAPWAKDVEVKPKGGEWTLVPSLPECTSGGQSVRHYRRAGTGT